MEAKIRERDACVCGHPTLAGRPSALDRLREDRIGALPLTRFPERSTQSGQQAQAPSVVRRKQGGSSLQQVYRRLRVPAGVRSAAGRDETIRRQVGERPPSVARRPELR
ncbi:MAG: hypothetical protein H0W05_07555 [Thermoleophilaceae bacterium]|nr:hypothetical protein [Thermoleophilaceae bacterium]